MATRIQVRRDSSSSWSSNNPTLSNGEIGFETDTYKFKIGDGSTSWSNLSYFSSGGSIELQTSESISTGDTVYLDQDTGRIRKADKSALNTAKVIGFATDSGVVDDFIEIRTAGTLSGFTGLIAGEDIYLNSSGGITQDTDDILQGEYKTYLGEAISSTEIFINIDFPVVQALTSELAIRAFIGQIHGGGIYKSATDVLTLRPISYHINNGIQDYWVEINAETDLSGLTGYPVTSPSNWWFVLADKDGNISLEDSSVSDLSARPTNTFYQWGEYGGTGYDHVKKGYYSSTKRIIGCIGKVASDDWVYINQGNEYEEYGFTTAGYLTEDDTKEYIDYKSISLIPSFFNLSNDWTLDGVSATDYRIIYANDFHVISNSTIGVRNIWIEGNFTIDSGSTLTLDPPKRIDGSDLEPPTSGNSKGAFGGGNGGTSTSGLNAGGTTRTLYSFPFYLNSAIGGAGGEGGYSYNYTTSYSGDGGGGSFSVGGAGGRGTNTNWYAGGGGGATGANGGGSYGNIAGGIGRGICFIFVNGNFTNEGTINISGIDGTDSNAQIQGAGGGGGGGILVIVCSGTYSNTGTITAKGGNGGEVNNYSATGDGGGGGGGGGHIEIFARTSSFGTVNVNGGTGGIGYQNNSTYNGSNGSNGTTKLVNISSGYTLQGAESSDTDFPWWNYLIEGFRK